MSALCVFFGHTFIADVDWSGRILRRFCVRCGFELLASRTPESTDNT